MRVIDPVILSSVSRIAEESRFAKGVKKRESCLSSEGGYSPPAFSRPSNLLKASICSFKASYDVVEGFKNLACWIASARKTFYKIFFSVSLYFECTVSRQFLLNSTAIPIKVIRDALVVMGMNAHATTYLQI